MKDDDIERIEKIRCMLNNALNMSLSSEMLLKISRKLDVKIVDYYKKRVFIQKSQK
ncbi:MAG: Spo0E family sporulation regulatory protein-aspartic acid phosphatase [Thermovenabulum sp.]|uniref:Spo0E family sporulation regulatory protein-aspartic acid phosphatase n=1 Tax=Thermovenabulum sp. TaxID=3100335 RepID=UPI003C7BE50D